MAEMTKTIHSCTAPVSTRVDSIAASMAMTIWAVTMMRRLDIRSARAPAQGVMRRMGAKFTAITQPSMAALPWVRMMSTSHDWAVRAIHCPMFVMRVPEK